MQKKRECWTIWSTSPPALAKRCPKMLTISESSSPSRKLQSTSPPTWVMVLYKKESVKGCHRLHWRYAKHVCNSIHFGNLAVSFAQKAETRDFPVAKLQVHANAAGAVKSAKHLRGCIFLPLKPQWNSSSLMLAHFHWLLTVFTE